MGSISFHLPDPLPAAADAALRRACLAGGYDQNPVPTHADVRGRTLTVRRDVNESGYLLVPWPVPSAGGLVTSTATLRERPEPYSLLVELARGKLNQVRCQTAEWHALGLHTPTEFDRGLREAAALFGRAVVAQPSADADATAARALDRGYELADKLVRLYTGQVFATRHHEEGKLATRFAARSDRPPDGPALADYKRAFTAAHVAFRWADLEPAESQYQWAAVDKAVAAAKDAGLPLTGGPVIDLGPGMLPAWAAGWEGDLPTLAAFMCDFLETALNRYKGSIRRWHVCSGFNHADAYGLSDDDRLRLAARLFEAAAGVDGGLELVLDVAQPWGDYLAGDDQTIAPLQFADDLLRTGLRIGAVALDIRVGSEPRAGLPRDLLETCRVIDLFGLLGVPLEIGLSCPSADSPIAKPTPFHWRGVPSPEAQAEWGTAIAGLALCKPHVRAVTWDHWSDADSHRSPHAGLVDAAGKAKPLLAAFQSLRAAHLA